MWRSTKINRQIYVTCFVVVSLLHYMILSVHFIKTSIASSHSKIYHVTLSQYVPKTIHKAIKFPKNLKKTHAKLKKVIKKKSQQATKQKSNQKSLANAASMKNNYLASIRETINNNLIYPDIAKKIQLQGIVEISFVVLSDGSVIQINILKTTAKILSTSAFDTVKNITFEPIPKALNMSRIYIHIPIKFTLK